MRLGLGTGSNGEAFRRSAGRARRQRVRGRCLCVATTSEVTAAQARGLGIPLTDLDTIDRLDLTVDGADEVDPHLNLIKGGGGALLREKIVAAASDRMVVIADQSKDVPVLGRQFPLPIEVNNFGLAGRRVGPCRKIMLEIVQGGWRADAAPRTPTAGKPFVTDGGHYILDALFGRISAPEALSAALLEVPGVVQHGLFLGLCHTVYRAWAGCRCRATLTGSELSGIVDEDDAPRQGYEGESQTGVYDRSMIRFQPRRAGWVAATVLVLSMLAVAVDAGRGAGNLAPTSWRWRGSMLTSPTRSISTATASHPDGRCAHAAADSASSIRPSVARRLPPVTGRGWAEYKQDRRSDLMDQIARVFMRSMFTTDELQAYRDVLQLAGRAEARQRAISRSTSS